MADGPKIMVHTMYYVPYNYICLGRDHDVLLAHGLLTLRHSGSSITSTPSPGVANSAEGTKYALRVLEGFVEGPRTHPALVRGGRPMPITFIWPFALPLPYSPAVDMPMTLRAAYSSSGIGSYDYPGRI